MKVQERKIKNKEYSQPTKILRNYNYVFGHSDTENINIRVFSRLDAQKLSGSNASLRVGKEIHENYGARGDLLYAGVAGSYLIKRRSDASFRR